MPREHFANPPHVSIPITDDRVLEVMNLIPREQFIPAGLKRSAYRDSALPIGFGQTISQPYIVALMTQLLELTGEEHVLEIGAGSGYQAAVLSRLARDVRTVEIVPELHDQAGSALRKLGCANVILRLGDGRAGWPEEAPFDRIIVTCAATQTPAPLLDQLAPGGRMVLPLGARGDTQHLTLVVKDDTGACDTRTITSVRFVPMTRR
jgi:protein-L-isoaspartate(D-aspartate) O-methyltransferase